MIFLDCLEIDELTNLIESLGFKKFRASQIYSFIHKNKIDSIDDITVLSIDQREILKKISLISKCKIIHSITDIVDNTKKYLIELYDGEIIEAVLMEYNDRNSICISSQVGCNMGCVFCASTKGGKARDLTSGEMLRQIYEIENFENKRIDNIVVMGQGEPLDNFSNLVKFLKIISDEKGANKSLRKITVSTCGIPQKIKDLADLNVPVTLALSLHRTTDESRSKLMPINRVYDLNSTIDAVKYYYEKTNRRVSFEYMVIGGENDSTEDAFRIKEMVKKTHAHVNVLELNPIEEFKNTGKKNAAKKFVEYLNEIGVNATLRKSKGKNIDGACGQLRRKWKEKR